MIYVVASVEDGIVRLEAGDDEKFIEADLLPDNVKEGDVLKFDGIAYSIDRIKTDERRAAVYSKYKILFSK